MTGGADRDVAQAIAEVARRLQAHGSPRETLQAMVELAVATIPGCDHAGVSIADGAIRTMAVSDEIPRLVDRVQDESGEGPCLDAIRDYEVFRVDDLRHEARWPSFGSRAARRTGVRSMLSFRLYLDETTLGALSLYSRRAAAFGDAARHIGAVFAAHAAVALQAARAHERVEALQADLEGSRRQTSRYAERAQFAIALQDSMRNDLADLAPLEVAARYVPASEAADVGGDWYDTFRLPGGAVAIVIGDLAGHDTNAAVAMAQTRSDLRALAVDRREPPGQVLGRLDAVLAHLHPDRSGTCVYGQVEERDGTWTVQLANAGHLPPLLISDRGARYVEAAPELLLGAGVARARTTVDLVLPPASVLLLYTDGLIERRDVELEAMLAELRDAAAALRRRTPEQLCDDLIARFAPEPSDDLCLLALRIPDVPTAG
jgi:serine phosphatase RsbU (regulator of sigma subunit)